MTAPPISSRRKKTQNRSLPSGNGKGPLQWGLTVTEETLDAPSYPQLDCPPLLGESKVNKGWGGSGETLLPLPKAHLMGRTSCPLWLSLRSCRAAPAPAPSCPGLQPHHTAVPTDSGPTEVRRCVKSGLVQVLSPCPSPASQREEKWQLGLLVQKARMGVRTVCGCSIPCSPSGLDLLLTGIL